MANAALVKNLPDGILVLDAQGRILEINPTAERTLGKNKAATLDNQLTEFWPELDNIVKENKSGHIQLPRDISDTRLYFDVSIESIADRYQDPAGKLVVLRDITELKQAEQKLEGLYNEELQLRSRLENEIKKRSKYTRTVVHELRNPLTSIIASSDMLEDQLKEEIHLSLVQNIRRASLNLEQRVNELFELARGELGLLKIEPVPLDMTQVILEAVAEMKPVASNKGITLSTEMPETPYWVCRDKSRLRQVLSNLLENSIKYAKKGRIIVRVYDYSSGLLLVQVEDSVRGIEKEMLENLFDPYQRKSNENEGTSGLGIGLALSKILVELHKGKIWAESTLGKGTTISFVIPYLKAENSENQLGTGSVKMN